MKVHPHDLLRIGLAAAWVWVLPPAGSAVAHGPRTDDPRDRTSPVLRVRRDPPAWHGKRRPVESGVRSLDGSGNNPDLPEMGAALAPLLRLLPDDYADGISALAGPERPGPRVISNLVSAQQSSIENPLRASDFLWQWGQFLDHDLDFTDGVAPAEPSSIPVPAGDLWFDPAGTGSATIPFNRSLYDLASGTDVANPRQQLNEITAWIDASNVYGSDEVRAAALRVHDGSGRLRTSEGNLLPYNTDGLPNAGGEDSSLFLAGDVRANEQVGLTALHTLFVREHNRWARRLAAKHPGWDEERIYQKARQLVGAEMQVITYREFLPALLGPRALRPYRGYDSDIDAGIANEFATAAFRFGHSALSPLLLRLDARGRPIGPGHLPLRDAFFAPERLAEEGGIEPLLRGLAAQACQRIDVQVVDDVRNFLFGPPGAGGFDLVSLNIQRGRDHGLPSYNDARESLGLGRVETFADLSSNPEIQQRLASAYENPDALDLWVGGLAEDPVHGGHVGELIRRILVDQFEALRDGDRFWYRRILSTREIRRVEATRLADVIRRNTSIGREIPDDVFHVRKRSRKQRHR